MGMTLRRDDNDKVELELKYVNDDDTKYQLYANVGDEKTNTNPSSVSSLYPLRVGINGSE